jgi:hypothetical protein
MVVNLGHELDNIVASKEVGAADSDIAATTRHKSLQMSRQNGRNVLAGLRYPEDGRRHSLSLRSASSACFT